MRCDYDLAGFTPDDICPECGLSIKKSDEEYTRRVRIENRICKIVDNVVISAVAIQAIQISALDIFFTRGQGMPLMWSILVMSAVLAALAAFVVFPLMAYTSRRRSLMAWVILLLCAATSVAGVGMLL